MYATYRREYENFTHLPGESINALFQRFTVVVNNMRANVDVLPYDDHDRAVLMKKFRQPRHEFTFGVGMTFISYPLVLTPLV
jgi:hypothetical protein